MCHAQAFCRLLLPAVLLRNLTHISNELPVENGVYDGCILLPLYLLLLRADWLPYTWFRYDTWFWFHSRNSLCPLQFKKSPLPPSHTMSSDLLSKNDKEKKFSLRTLSRYICIKKKITEKMQPEYGIRSFVNDKQFILSFFWKYGLLLFQPNWKGLLWKSGNT